MTARHPADHDWHNGIGIIPDVSGTNFWGGRTYIHVALVCSSTTTEGSWASRLVLRDESFTQELQWIGHDGSVYLREQRLICWGC